MYDAAVKNKGRLGFTTGACAAAAAKAALLCLMDNGADTVRIEISFPGGEHHHMPLAFVRRREGGAEAGVVKDAGDDPDITDKAIVKAFVEWGNKGDIEFLAGEGVGIVTKKGLSIPPGEPAINPGPRDMIRTAIREVTDRPVRVTISIPGGRDMAQRTYNPRLGIVNGLSVLGTTGRVRPFSCEAMTCSVLCQLDVARASGIRAPVLAPGNIGEKSARRHLALSSGQIIEVGNEWGAALEAIPRYSFSRILIWGHPGKLAKLADRQWDTHSSRSGSALQVVQRMAASVLSRDLEGYITTEGLFADLEVRERRRLADMVSAAIAKAARDKAGGDTEISVVLVDMKGDIIGTQGDILQWQCADHTA